MTTFQTVQLSLQAVSACAVVIALTFTARQIRLLAANYRDLHEWNRRKAAQDASEKWGDFAEDAIRLSEAFHFDKHHHVANLETIVELFGANKTLEASLHRILNYLETLAIGVRNGVFDEEIIKFGFRLIMPRTLRRYGPYVDHRRDKVGQVWIELSELVQRWEKDENTRSARTLTGDKI